CGYHARTLESRKRVHQIPLRWVLPNRLAVFSERTGTTRKGSAHCREAQGTETNRHKQHQRIPRETATLLPTLRTASRNQPLYPIFLPARRSRVSSTTNSRVAPSGTKVETSRSSNRRLHTNGDQRARESTR